MSDYDASLIPAAFEMRAFGARQLENPAGNREIKTKRERERESRAGLEKSAGLRDSRVLGPRTAHISPPPPLYGSANLDVVRKRARGCRRNNA